MEITNEMLERAMIKAVELKVFPKIVDIDSYVKNWKNMKKILEAATRKE